ncbi:sporulation integral membrane protein YtvI [Calderihabitans maritimus]|uniref:Sporulation integral membrane protein YtvI n=1 Tax=Calderihabitans maritimus TaxID=1246530 RepID=A0A1Z5HYB9_9FIRM|nr:sporulation integral membrane protein YtvI [Calderihabitans maritimus]GAW94315.1 sporulation integral membrane protein YtvI [Calderihabitans maritimus]
MRDVPPGQIKFLMQILIVLGIFLCSYLAYYYLYPALVSTIGYILPLLTPFILGIVLAALIEPLVQFCERKAKISRGFSVVAILLLLLGSTITLLMVIISRLVVELIKLSKNLPNYSQTIISQINDFFYQVQDFYLVMEVPEQVVKTIEGSVEGFLLTLRATTTVMANYLIDLLASVPSWLLILLVAIIATFFLSRDKDIIKKTFLQIIPAPWKQNIEMVGSEVGAALIGFLRAQIILSSITTFLSVVGLYLLGLDYSLTLGILVGIMDIIPILGPGTIFLPWITLEFILGNVRVAIALTVLYGLVTLVRQVLQAKVVADQVGLHPLATLVSIYIGLKALGLLGVIIGPIILVIFKALKKAGLFARWL